MHPGLLGRLLQIDPAIRECLGYSVRGAILNSVELYTPAPPPPGTPASPPWATFLLAAGFLVLASRGLRRPGLATTAGV